VLNFATLKPPDSQFCNLILLLLVIRVCSQGFSPQNEQIKGCKIGKNAIQNDRKLGMKILGSGVAFHPEETVLIPGFFSNESNRL